MFKKIYRGKPRKILLMVLFFVYAPHTFSQEIKVTISSAAHHALNVVHNFMHDIDGEREWNSVLRYVHHFENQARLESESAREVAQSNILDEPHIALMGHWSSNNSEESLPSEYSEFQIQAGTALMDWVVSLHVAGLAFIPVYLKQHKNTVSQSDAKNLLNLLVVLNRSLQSDRQFLMTVMKARFKSSEARASLKAGTAYERACRYILNEKSLQQTAERLYEKVRTVESDKWGSQRGVLLMNRSPEFRRLDVAGHHDRALDAMFPIAAGSEGFLGMLRAITARCSQQFGLHAQTR